MNILQINSSARSFENGQGSTSTQLANELVASLRQAHPQAGFNLRDLTRQPHPQLDQRSAAQAARVAQDDALIAELQAADVVVIGVPMYNFGVSSQLKNWIDAVARAGVTFRYTEQGAQGLLTGKKVYAVLARGGKYRDTPADSQVPYLKTTLSFLGLTDVEFIYAEGLAMGPDAAAAALQAARAQIEAVAA
jgi:FMN-dependent NADH-azoreductase